MIVSAQYLGKLLFWTFMSLAPDAPSGRSLQTFLGQLPYRHHQHHLLHDHHEAYLRNHDGAHWYHDHNNVISED